MAFKQTKGDKTVEAYVQPAPGGMFKGYVRVSIQRGDKTIVKSSGRLAGRPVVTEAAALELAELAAQQELTQ